MSRLLIWSGSVCGFMALAKSRRKWKKNKKQQQQQPFKGRFLIRFPTFYAIPNTVAFHFCVLDTTPGCVHFLLFLDVPRWVRTYFFHHDGNLSSFFRIRQCDPFFLFLLLTYSSPNHISESGAVLLLLRFIIFMDLSNNVCVALTGHCLLLQEPEIDTTSPRRRQKWAATQQQWRDLAQNQKSAVQQLEFFWGPTPCLMPPPPPSHVNANGCHGKEEEKRS